MLSIAAVIITQTKSYEISAMSINTVVKQKFIRLSVCLLNAPPIWHQVTSALRHFFDVMALYIKLHFTKIEMRSLFRQQTNKHHIHVIPL